VPSFTQVVANMVGFFSFPRRRNIRIASLWLTKDEALNNVAEIVFNMIDPENTNKKQEYLEQLFYYHYYWCHSIHELPWNDRINNTSYLDQILEDFLTSLEIEFTKDYVRNYFEQHFNRIENPPNQQHNQSGTVICL